MEKTLAREIYKQMEPGKEYSTSDLVDLVFDDFCSYYPEYAETKPEKSVRQVVQDEIWKVVKTGYAKTFKRTETGCTVRGLRFGAEPEPWRYYKYECRYFVRTK